MSEPQVVLITGASSGIGALTGRRLAGEGFRVFGTSRDPAKASPPDGVELLELDVTSSESIASCIDELCSRAGRIDVLINNAGQSHRSLIEETSLEDARAILEVNFWGTVAMTDAVLPLMREQGSGRIINLGSLAGLVGTPGQGFYGSAKHALEGFTETLRAELGHLPVEVCLVEPGFFRTGLEKSMVVGEKRVSDYDEVRDSLEAKLDAEFEGGGDADIVARRIAELVTHSDPPLRTVIGSDAKKIFRLWKWLPQSWFIAGTQRQFGLGEKG